MEGIGSLARGSGMGGCVGASCIAGAVCHPARTPGRGGSRSLSGQQWPEQLGQWPSGEVRVQSFHDDHVLLQKVGRGSFASVYMTRRVHSDQQEFAVKVIDLRAKLSGNQVGDRQVSDRRCNDVWREVELLRRLEGSAHVVQLLDAYMEAGLAYVAMEKCDVTLLQALERSSKLKEATLRPVLRQMLQALAAVHAAGIVHRDVKPDNFLCAGSRGTVKLCDFGLSRAVADDSLVGVYGTPPFMAPEMLSGAPYGASVDVWGFGVVAYVLHYGTFPYLPWERSPSAMKACILEGVPQPAFVPSPELEAAGVRISAPTTALLSAALRRAPAERLTAAAALAGGLLDASLGGEQQPSLRPVLRAAKAVGAFDPPGGPLLQEKTDVDERLSILQAQRHRTLLHHNFRRAGRLARPEAELKTNCCAKAAQ